MPWIKVDDHLPDHPKIVSVGPLAAWLYVCGLCYCNQLLTNGFIPADQIDRLLPPDPMRRPSEATDQLAKRLCSVGLWSDATRRGVEGYRVHDYLSYQTSRAEVLAAREKNADRQRRFRGNGHATTR